VGSFVDGLSVSVHVLQQAEGGETQWVKRDGRSLADRVMFLGRPSSFAVDAARFGVSSGGCAYFVMKSELYGGVWSRMDWFHHLGCMCKAQSPIGSTSTS